MLERLLQILKNLFGISSNTGDNEDTNPIPQPTPPKPPVKEDEDPSIIEDAQDASEMDSSDTITVVDENKDVVISGDDPETFVDVGFEGGEQEIIEEETEIPVFPVITNHRPRYLWCLDNGHGKTTRGKKSPIWDGDKQLFEAELNRNIVERIMKRLDEIGVRYFDVVPDYDSVGNILEERVNRANRKKSSLPKIFLSVHSNAGPTLSPNDWVNPNISGVETWHYHGSIKGKRLAIIFQKYIVAATGWKNRHIKSRAEKQFYVLKKTRMPAILTENGFYNNEMQAKELVKNSVRQKIAEAHVQAILVVEREGI